jgi:RNA polymerase sigma-70 factor (ECF subfamily)
LRPGRNGFGAWTPLLIGGGSWMGGASENSFEALALPHMELVYRIARRLTRDHHEAEDLVQETYLKAYAAFGRFEMRQFGIRPWLLRILNNTFLNRQQRQQRAPRAADQQALDEIHADDPVITAPELDFEHLDGEVKAALDSLSPEFRSVLLLWATMEFSYKEIAEILEVPVGTVMSRLHRARKQLIDALAEYARERGIRGAGVEP